MALQLTRTTGAGLLPGTARVAAPVRRLPTRSTVSTQAGRREEPEQQVSYGADWYTQTREATRPKRTVREEIERRRQANLAANNGRERKDLYTDNWEGSEWKGSPFNILNVLILLLILTPTAGLIFARFTYGTLWG